MGVPVRIRIHDEEASSAAAYALPRNGASLLVRVHGVTYNIALALVTYNMVLVLVAWLYAGGPRAVSVPFLVCGCFGSYS